MSTGTTNARAVGAAPDTGLSGNLSWLLSQASHALSTEMTAALEEIGLFPRGYCVLSTAVTGAHTQSELAKMVGLDKTTMVVTIDELERAGLAERRPSHTDRRARVIAVTTAGRRKVTQAEEVVARVQREVLDSLPPAERAVLVDALAALVCGRLSAPAACERAVRRRA